MVAQVPDVLICGGRVSKTLSSHGIRHTEVSQTLKDGRKALIVELP